MELQFFNEKILSIKESFKEYNWISNRMKNPIKRFLFNKKSEKKFKDYLYRLKDIVYTKELNIDFLYNFILSSEICGRVTKIKESEDVYNQTKEFMCTYFNDDGKPIFVILLYPPRHEIRFAKYVEEGDRIIQYPRHVFIGHVSKETAVYEYDEEMINFIRNFIWETYMNYLGDDLKCLIQN